MCREHPICLPVCPAVKPGREPRTSTHRRDESGQKESAEANSQRKEGLRAVQSTEVAGVSEQQRPPKTDFLN